MRPYGRRAQAQEALKKYELALADLREALAVDPKEKATVEAARRVSRRFFFFEALSC